jgi:hypothetical protein
VVGAGDDWGGVVDGELGTDCGGWFGACNPRELGFAAGGN